MDRLRDFVAWFTVLAFLHGCASQAVQPYAAPSGGDRTLPRDLVVTAARFQPEANLDLLLRSKAEVAGAGAGSGALQGAVGLMQGMGSCHDQFCGAAFLLLLPVFMGVGAVMGAVKDAPSAATAEVIASGQKAMQAGIAQLDLQRSVQAALAQALRSEGVAGNVAEEWDVGPATPEERPAYATLSPQTQDAVLETSVLGFQFRKVFQPDSKKLVYALSMRTRVRLLAPGSRDVLDELVHLHESSPHTAGEWLGGEARLFEAALREAVRETVQSTVHEMFLLYHPDTTAAPVMGGPLVPDFVLRPEYPQPARTIDLRGAFMDRYKPAWGGLLFVPVDDARPTLKWEAFPRPFDMAALGGPAGRFDVVRYELMIREARFNGTVYTPGEPVYRRDHLSEPAHRIEHPLQACGRYFWTVRAHFLLDGWPRVTEWSGAYGIFPMAKPWEVRRGLKAGLVYPAGVDQHLMFLPFRVPAASGAACK